MKKRQKGIYITIISLFISIIVFNILYRNIYLLNGTIILIGLFTVEYFGLMKNNNYLKPNVTRIVISCLLSFFIITYMSGLILGFSKTVFSFRIKYIFENIVLDFFAIVAEELIRYIICKNEETKIPIVLYTIVLIFLNIIIVINGYDLSEKEVMFIFLSTVVLPVISRELVCSYLTYHVSYTPSLIYKSLITLYEYTLPIIPNLGNYLYSVANIILPYFIYLFSNKTIRYKEKASVYVKKTTRRIVYMPIITILLVLVLLVSGIFSHKMISIGSNSMKPVYERGDAIIYQKAEANELKEGEILVFVRDGTVVTHRIIKLQKSGNNYIIQTKGDANETPDKDFVTEAEVLGKVTHRIKYIGYPTLWVRGIFEGREISD